MSVCFGDGFTCAVRSFQLVSSCRLTLPQPAGHFLAVRSLPGTSYTTLTFNTAALYGGTTLMELPELKGRSRSEALWQTNTNERFSPFMLAQFVRLLQLLVLRLLSPAPVHNVLGGLFPGKATHFRTFMVPLRGPLPGRLLIVALFSAGF